MTLSKYIKAQSRASEESARRKRPEQQKRIRAFVNAAHGRGGRQAAQRVRAHGQANDRGRRTEPDQVRSFRADRATGPSRPSAPEAEQVEGHQMSPRPTRRRISDGDFEEIRIDRLARIRLCSPKQRR